MYVTIIIIKNQYIYIYVYTILLKKEVFLNKYHKVSLLMIVIAIFFLKYALTHVAYPFGSLDVRFLQFFYLLYIFILIFFIYKGFRKR
jgi:hypothetical protein